MKLRTIKLSLLLASVMFFAASHAIAQIGNTGAFSQPNQQAGQGTQSPFGNRGASAGQAGQQRAGQIGGGQQGGQNQRQVGGQDGFVGTDADQIRNQRRSERQQRRALFDFAIESFNEVRDSRRERNARRNAPSPVRVRLRPLFNVQPPNSAIVTSRAQASLERALPASAASAKVSIVGSRATIEGTVASEYESKLAAKMISLTPGIYEINNQLSVEPSTVKSTGTSPGTPTANSPSR